jgi:nucleoside-diphosphate-sugar epimerase
MKTAIVTGAGGFIGSHMVKRLKSEGYYVTGIDLKKPEFDKTHADEFSIQDLRKPFQFWDVDEVYNFAANMGGAAYIFSGDNDADVMHDSALININVAEACRHIYVDRVFFSSSACVYPDYVQMNPDHCALVEAMAYPARPDSEYGFEKLFSERLYAAYARNYGLRARIARLHNVHGPFCTWQHGREKAPAAICRKVAAANAGQAIDIYGDGNQTRSFLYVDECVEGIRRLMDSEVSEPLNIGSSEMISINDLVKMVADIASKEIKINHVPGPQGVRGRSSDNTLIKEKLGWAPSQPLVLGMEKTYAWISEQVKRQAQCKAAV